MKPQMRKSKAKRKEKNVKKVTVRKGEIKELHKGWRKSINKKFKAQEKRVSLAFEFAQFYSSDSE